jgi:hypothetical protein
MINEDDELYCREGTMQAVSAALARAGLTEQQIINTIFDMQNSGIYFREAKRPPTLRQRIAEIVSRGTGANIGEQSWTADAILDIPELAAALAAINVLRELVCIKDGLHKDTYASNVWATARTVVNQYDDQRG